MADEIIPDDKNWTWVLERRCDECGFDSSSFDARLSATVIRDLAVRWAAALAGDGVRARPRPGVWSTLEYACHVRDVFRIFDTRLRLMLEETDPSFANWDQDKTAVEDDYGSQNPAIVSGEIVQAAAELADRFDSVAGAQWERKGFRSDGSVFTVESMARYLMHDPVHHLWDIGAEVPFVPTSVRTFFPLVPVGHVRSSRTEPHDDAWDTETAHIELAEPFDARALAGLGAFSHCVIIYVFDRAGWDLSRMSRHPRGNKDWPEVGIFAQRAKDRPNRLGVSVCRIIGTEGPTLHVAGLDAIDGTPVVDIKPWMDEFGARGVVAQPGWSHELMKDYW